MSANKREVCPRCGSRQATTHFSEAFGGPPYAVVCRDPWHDQQPKEVACRMGQEAEPQGVDAGVPDSRFLHRGRASGDNAQVDGEMAGGSPRKPDGRAESCQRSAAGDSSDAGRPPVLAAQPMKCYEPALDGVCVTHTRPLGDCQQKEGDVEQDDIDDAGHGPECYRLMREQYQAAESLRETPMTADAKLSRSRLVFVDCEADGPCPTMGRCTEVGAVLYGVRETFHGDMRDRAHEAATWRDFDAWLTLWIPKGRPIMVSDNPAFDFQWVNDGFWRTLGRNPFGHSARRLADFYAGLKGNFYDSQAWKRLRVTPHDHNPVNDAMGNLEAFERMLKGER